MTYVTLMKGWNQDNSLTLDYAKLCKNTLLLQYPCKFTLALLIVFGFYSFFMYVKDEGRKLMVFVICEERKTTKNIKKN